MTGALYRAFEDRYRGSRDLIKSRLRVYLPFISPLSVAHSDAQAIDLGCGRGEWLELLASAGFKGLGVDLDDSMLEACRERGLNVSRTDVISALQELPGESQLVVSGFHIAAHLDFAVLQTLIQEALRVLKPAGLLILETPNPENIVVGSCNFYLDPTHEKPLPAQLLAFLPEYYGFARIKTLRLQEAAGLSDGMQSSLSLMDVLGGASPDYAIVAQKAAAEDLLRSLHSAFDADYGVSLAQLAQRHEHQTKDRLQQTDLSFASALEASAQVAKHRSDETDAALGLIRAKLVRIEASLHSAEARLSTLELKLERTLPRRLGRAVKNRVARPLLLTASRLLRPHEQFRNTVNHWLLRHAPAVHSRLQGVIRRSRPPVHLDSTWVDTVGILHAVSDLHPVLSNPDLLNLDRPTDLQAGLVGATGSATLEGLEPVFEIDQMRHSAASVCFVVPIASNDPTALDRTVQSVLRQTDPSWELLLCATEELALLADEWLDIDWRIRFVPRGERETQARTLYRAAVQSTTRLIGLLSHGDLVDDDLVKMIGERARKHPQIDFVYTDEAQKLTDDRMGNPFFKPDWSPEHQQSVNMVGRFAAMRKSLLLSASAPSETQDEAAEYGLLLDVTSRATHIAHLDEVLYLREAGAAPAVGGFFSPAALEDARSALQKHMQRHVAVGNVEAELRNGSLKVAWPVPDILVTLLILTGAREREIPGRGKVVLATNFVRSIISKSSFRGYKIIIVDDGVVPDDLRELLRLNGHETVSYSSPGEFSFANKANFATALVPSGIAILLNDDLEVVSSDWIQALAGQAARPEIGVVGARLLFADKSLQHAGIALGFHGSAGHMFHRAPADGNEYGGFANISRNYSAVTGAVMAYRKDVFDTLGGFDERFKTDYNDIDFCLRSIEAGYRVVYTPEATLYHFHNSSLKRTRDNEVERKAFLAQWSKVVARDPFFSKHFQTLSQDLPLVEA